MPTRWLSPTSARGRAAQKTRRESAPSRRPTPLPPPHPGQVLLEKFLNPIGITQTMFALRLGVSFPRLNEIIRGKRSVTPDTALRLAQVLGTSPNFWLNLQIDWDLWQAMRSKEAVAIADLRPLQ